MPFQVEVALDGGDDDEDPAEEENGEGGEQPDVEAGDVDVENDDACCC